MTDRNPDKLTPNQILEKVYIYLAHAQAEPKTITPEEHRAMLAAVFPAFSELYLDGASLTRAALAAVRALRPAGEPEEWRELALQFDGHRIEALSMLRYAERHINEYATVRDILREQLATIRAFLAKPPLSGEEVLAQRLAALASPIIDAKVAEDARAIRIAILKALYGNDVGERPEPTLELLFALIAVAKSGRAANASEGGGE